MIHSSILEGVQVLDLSTVLAGPSVGSFLAELGAEVIKIESPQGDVTRTWFSPSEDQSTTSAYYLSVNARKKVKVMDLKTERSALDNMLQQADIVLLNFKSSDEEKFDLVPKQILEKYPHLIIGKIKGFEDDEQRVAYDVAIQAETGHMSINGEKGAAPLKLPIAFMDVLAAHQLKEGILCALLNKTTTGKGMIVECSLESAGLVSLMNQGSLYLKTGNAPKASGSLHPNIAPYGEQLVFKDNVRIVLAIGSDKQFEGLCHILKSAELLLDERYTSNVLRVEFRNELLTSLQLASKNFAFHEIRQKMITKNIPFGQIKDLSEVMQSKAANEKIMLQENGNRSLSHIGFRIIK
ncbi:MAG: hypothetical protein RLY35_88 [Bacteroidota bacterium]